MKPFLYTSYHSTHLLRKHFPPAGSAKRSSSQTCDELANILNSEHRSLPQMKMYSLIILQWDLVVN